MRDKRNTLKKEKEESKKMDLWDLAKNVSKLEKRLEPLFEKFFDEGRQGDYGFCAGIYRDIEKMIFESYGVSKKDCNSIYPDFYPVSDFLWDDMSKEKAIEEMEELQRDIPKDMALMKKRLKQLDENGEYEGLSKEDWIKVADEIGRSVGQLITFPEFVKEAKKQWKRDKKKWTKTELEEIFLKGKSADDCEENYSPYRCEGCSRFYYCTNQRLSAPV